MRNTKIPSYDSMMNPLLKALKALGGSGTNEEMNNKVAQLLDLSDEQLEIPHKNRGSQSEFEYRLAWTRTYLKKYGLLENSSRGIWALTTKGRKKEKVNPKTVRKFVQAQAKKLPTPIPSEELVEPTWRDELLAALLEMDPSAFERLTQRLLRESGFIQVEVTGQSGDGGVDGKGIMRIGGLLSFHVIFQCKRYKGSVPVGHVRDFRGAMVGRADKGLLITTGNFTKDAIKEATRDGAPAIDLIDGDLLIDKLKEFSLGIKTEKVIVEQVTVDRDWFMNI